MWHFLDSTPVIEITIRNPLLDQSFPSAKNGVMAVLDTGYDGFLTIPGSLFKNLGFHKLKTNRVKAVLANGKTTDLVGAFGSIIFHSSDNLVVDGLIETGAGQSEILIGMDGIRNLLVELDCCMKRLTVQKCTS